jgi:hypothetical protein
VAKGRVEISWEGSGWAHSPSIGASDQYGGHDDDSVLLFCGVAVSLQRSNHSWISSSIIYLRAVLLG